MKTKTKFMWGGILAIIVSLVFAHYAGDKTFLEYWYGVFSMMFGFFGFIMIVAR